MFLLVGPLAMLIFFHINVAVLEQKLMPLHDSQLFHDESQPKLASKESSSFEARRTFLPPNDLVSLEASFSCLSS